MQRTATFLPLLRLLRLLSLLSLLLCFLLCLGACSKDKTGEVTTTGAQPTGTTRAGSVASAKPVDSAKPSSIPPAGNEGHPILTIKGGLVSPESAQWDDVADEYVISSINGDPFAADGNGFVTRVKPDGTVVSAKWIDKLNAPKGITFARDNVYVADIDRVKIFDRKNASAKGEVLIPKATFVNDLATLPDGRVIASETGIRAGKQAFELTGNDSVWIIETDDKTLTPVAKPNKELGGPNGILVRPDKTWVLGFNSGELYSLDLKTGARADVQKLPKPALDGIVGLANGDVLISSWDASGVYRGRPGGGAFALVIEGLKAPADIGYDTKRSRLLVPLFHDNEVRVYDVK